MTARIVNALGALSEAFWLLPGLMVAASVLAAVALVDVDRSGVVPNWLIASSWLYNGGSTGARTLLGAVASSTIGVAGTVFSITIAALSLAAGQMGPRLLRTFTKDRGNQITLGAFLGTFSYALMILRSVRAPSEGQFVPHVALTVALLLAFSCVGTLVYFVGHMASRLSVDVVIESVSRDVRSTFGRIALEMPQVAPPPQDFWRDATPIVDERHGYLQQLDGDGLADWAAKNATAIRLLVRLGDYVFPGTPIALMTVRCDGVERAIRNATALGPQRASPADPEFAIRQLVEVAVRALSPGINDPETAISVLDRLGAALCELAPLRLPSGVYIRGGRPVLVVPSIAYDGLLDTMFFPIRQNASGSAAVLIRLLEVLTAVVSSEHDSRRVAALQRHADLVLADADRTISTPSDRDDVHDRHAAFEAMQHRGPVASMHRYRSLRA